MKAVILAGGGGTRLWPLSTQKMPKQFQPLISAKSMLEETIDRLDFLNPEDLFIAINKDHLDIVKNLCPKIPDKNIIIEPALRDTASCIGLAAAIVQKRHPDEIMAIIYADHLIKNKKEFREKLKTAEEIARNENTLNIVEVEAKEPDANYGYIKLGKLYKKSENTEIFNLDSFVEKPDKETAKKFVESGNYLWNTGIYIWKAKTLLEQYKKNQPETYKKLNEIMEAYDTDKQNETLNSVYPTLEKISIDYAIMEKADPKDIKIIKADLGWSDIGNWEAIWKEQAKEKSENVMRGDVKSIDSKGCLIYSDNGKKIAAIGLEDIIIVDTQEGLLVCKKQDSKRTKEIF